MIKVCVIERLCTYTGILENTATREGYEAHGPFIYSTNFAEHLLSAEWCTGIGDFIWSNHGPALAEFIIW